MIMKAFVEVAGLVAAERRVAAGVCPRGGRVAKCGRKGTRWMCTSESVDAVEKRSRGLDAEDDDVFVLEKEEEFEDFDEGGLILSSPKMFHVLSVERVESRKVLRWTDSILFLTLIALVYVLVTASVSVMSGPYETVALSTSISSLPWYTALSTTRIFLGYIVSLIFAIVYAYCAYRVRFAANLLVLIIDILQSVPLLSFLPGVVLGLMGLFPGQRIGVELAAMLLLFTSMAWNMVLGFYQSLCNIPRELVEAAAVFRLSSWKRFWTLELPAGAVGLVWNSIVSIAGGWFFLISIESFELGNQDFRLPGIGAFLAAAAERADYGAISWGLLSLVAVIVVADFVVWRPLIAWSAKFTYGSSLTQGNAPKSTVLSILQRSKMSRAINKRILSPWWNRFVNVFPLKTPPLTPRKALVRTSKRRLIASFAAKILSTVVISGFVGIIGYAGWLSVGILSVLSLQTWFSLSVDAMYTLGRVILALILSMLWTVPLGVAVGRDAKLASKIQPLVQVLASVPATALFPFVLLALARIGNGLEIGSVLLMMLGTMWYVLFNVIAGAQAIPSEFFEVDMVYGGGNRFKRWRTLILPGIFPYLITGMVTAVGGAWNASIVSEYVTFRGEVIATRGLGALISRSAAAGDYSMLLAGTLVMCVLVLLTNRLFWGPLYRLADTKYKILQS